MQIGRYLFIPNCSFLKFYKFSTEKNIAILIVTFLINSGKDVKELQTRNLKA